MKLVIISDTHGNHVELGVLEGDVLIHCGDVCNPYDACDGDLEHIDDWFAKQQFGHIFVIGGNHDAPIQRKSQAGVRPFENATYLEGTSAVVDGVKFYGAPWIPQLVGWAFYCDEATLRDKWAQIPDDVDVLITHTPPWRILDSPRRRSAHAGCELLLARLAELSPRVHCFGHIHASHGKVTRDGTIYVNAAVVGDSHYEVSQKPIVVELDV